MRNTGSKNSTEVTFSKSRRLGYLLLCTCYTCDVNCVGVITSLCLLIVKKRSGPRSVSAYCTDMDISSSSSSQPAANDKIPIAQLKRHPRTDNYVNNQKCVEKTTAYLIHKWREKQAGQVVKTFAKSRSRKHGLPL